MNEVIFIICLVALITSVVVYGFNCLMKPYKRKKLVNTWRVVILRKDVFPYISLMYKNYPDSTVLNFNNSIVRYLFDMNIIVLPAQRYPINTVNFEAPFLLQPECKRIYEHILKNSHL